VGPVVFEIARPGDVLHDVDTIVPEQVIDVPRDAVRWPMEIIRAVAVLLKMPIIRSVKVLDCSVVNLGAQAWHMVSSPFGFRLVFSWSRNTDKSV